MATPTVLARARGWGRGFDDRGGQLATVVGSSAATQIVLPILSSRTGWGPLSTGTSFSATANRPRSTPQTGRPERSTVVPDEPTRTSDPIGQGRAPRLEIRPLAAGGRQQIV